MELPREVSIVETGPRDGLQNIQQYVETGEKVNLINALSKTGLRVIEVTSFVHPKAVPQLRDAAQVMSQIQHDSTLSYRVLVPNMKGVERALESGASHINFVLAASNSFNKNNVNRSIAESLEEFRRIVEFAHKKKIDTVSVSISTAFGCPFEKRVPMQKVVEIALQLERFGVDQIILCDTTGMANPMYVRELVQEMSEVINRAQIGVHFHDTRSTGLANIFAALSMSITIIETCVGGLGGCPFAPGANGNVATEDIVNMLDDMGIKTGVNLGRLIKCAKMAQDIIGRELPGQVMKVGPTYG